ncbi:hypothetical protein H8K33_08305 [Undibacterium amnicola]|uniref:DUF3426 domain-containing protein n=1 Tax=Undibacterium amnicola TaxID=1834038 RepID=A0ABR6XPU8_9BURK|nr:hypothetical protein [Undibacterium amnicola]MBC3831509.1 hypothetical protein [Undibacterium amnicola]
MEHIEKVIIGLILFIVTSVVAYLFRMRQLYAAAPKLYRHAPISRAGSLCELIVYNKGNQAEESIQVALDPDLKLELLASSSSDISLESATLKVDRLHKGCEASAMLLVENGLLDHTKILSVSSKAKKGTVCKKVSDVPPNFALTFLFFAFLIGFFPAMIYGIKVYESLNASYVEYRLREPYKAGWSNLASYHASDLRTSYSDQEFPIRASSRQAESSKKTDLTFEVYNKTALPMTVYVDLQGKREIGSPYFASVEVAPMSKGTLAVREPEPSSEASPSKLEFSIKSGSEFVHGLLFESARK